MTKSNYQIIHDILLSKGFKRCKSNNYGNHCYQANLLINEKEFGVEFCFSSVDFIDLPIIRVISWPKGIASCLPHLEENGKLCYLDHEFIYLDRYDVFNSIHTILDSLNNLLTQYASSDKKNLQEDYADEFTAYWHGEYNTFVRSWEEKTTISLFERKSLSNQNLINECVVHDSIEQLEYWMKTRNVTKKEKFISFSNVISIELKNPSVIPINTIWPPKSINELLGWLVKIEHRAAQSLMYKLEKILSNKKSVFIIISTFSGHVGAYVTFNKTVIEQLRRKKNRKNKFKKKLYDIFCGRYAAKSFKRYSVEDASDKRITSRNQLTEFSLIGKKIAIIGCGTVGGYAAHLLSQLGVGIKNINNGCLDLYDNDLLLADNIGRHILNSSYIMDNKALATAHYVRSQSYSEDLNINGFNEKIDPSQLKKWKKYDIIIDLTGNEAFSTAFNHYIHKKEQNIHVLYAWIVLGGKGVRSLLDDFTGACYRCLRVENEKGITERFKLLTSSSKPPEPITRQCGSAYFPYASSASVSCAGLVQQTIIDYFSDNSYPRFRHLSLTSDIMHTKHSNPKKLKECSVCSNI